MSKINYILIAQNDETHNNPVDRATFEGAYLSWRALQDTPENRAKAWEDWVVIPHTESGTDRHVFCDSMINQVGMDRLASFTPDVLSTFFAMASKSQIAITTNPSAKLKEWGIERPQEEEL